MGDRKATLEGQPAGPQMGQATRCVQQLSELIELWERARVPYDHVARWIDRYHIAARLADRFRREQPSLARAIATTKSLESDAEIHRYLEGWVLRWDVDESDAYRQLLLLGQGFVSAPSDPSGFGLWFRVIHQDRWNAILEKTSLSDEEMFDFIRHVMEDDGLASVELYERMIDMSQWGVTDPASTTTDGPAAMDDGRA